jgi:hypothetical protein
MSHTLTTYAMPHHNPTLIEGPTATDDVPETVEEAETVDEAALLIRMTLNLHTLSL